MQRILVTGAKGGIGSAIHAALADAGHMVIAVGHDEADLTRISDIQKLAERVQQECGGIDWLVCAHGYLDVPTSLEEQSAEAIEKTFAVNTLSLFYLAQQFLPLIPSGGGIVVIGSSAGIEANGRIAAYSASKAAAVSFAQGLARNRSTLKFYAVCPGPTNTSMRERFAHDAADKQSPSVVAQTVAGLIAGATDAKSGDVLLVRDGSTSTASRI